MTTNTETWEERRAREQAEARQQTVALFAYAALIVRALGPGWSTPPLEGDSENFTHSHPHIRHTSGAEFWIGHEWRDKTRIHVAANWPKDDRGQEQRPYFSEYSEFGTGSPSITFAASKTPEQAVKDITRRFLSAFLPLWDKQAAVVGRQNTSRSKRAALAQRIAEITGGSVRGPRDQYDTNTLHTVSLYSARKRHAISDVEFGDDDRRITIKATVTLEELAALVASLARPDAD